MISEFSYGYALTEELSRGILGRVVGAPIFPSLYQEGQIGGGFDLELPRYGSALFLQFKLSHYMYYSSSKEWNFWYLPYYRMHLRPLRHSDQHILLMDLETSGEEVYYTAPMFYTSDELNDAYINRQVYFRSAFFSPNDIGTLPDDNLHYIVFEPDDPIAYRCSQERKPVHWSHGEALLENIEVSFTKKHQKIDLSFFKSITHNFLGLLEERHKDLSVFKDKEFLSQKLESLQREAAFAAYLSRAYFDAELFVVNIIKGDVWGEIASHLGDGPSLKY